MSDQWETFCDVGYYHMWRLRLKTERGWNDGFHINTKAEAEGLCELLNKLEGEVERERALANEAIATWRKTREERDAALIGYNECRATIEDARRALGATAHEGPLLAAMRVTEQRDRAQSKIENQAERIKYLEGATNHATGTPLSKMREQRDRLAEALRELCETLLADKPRDITDLLNKAGDALIAVKGGNDE